MERKDIKKFMDIVSILYPSYKFPKDKATLTLATKIWIQLFAPYKLNLVIEALKNTAKQSDYFNAAKVACECEELTLLLSNNDKLNKTEIYNEILKAISFEDTQAKFESLSPIAKQAVGIPAQLYRWAQVPLLEFETIIAPILKGAIEKEIRNLIKKQAAKRAGLI